MQQIPQVKMQLRRVPFKSIVFRENPRTMVSPRAVRYLAESIAEIGLLTPLLVEIAPGKGEGFILLDGHRRFRAMRELLTEQDQETELVRVLIVDTQGHRDDMIAAIEGGTRGFASFDSTNLWARMEANGSPLERTAKVSTRKATVIRQSIRARELVEAGKITPGKFPVARQALLSGCPPDEIVAGIKNRVVRTSLQARDIPLVRRHFPNWFKSELDWETLVHRAARREGRRFDGNAPR